LVNAEGIGGNRAGLEIFVKLGEPGESFASGCVFDSAEGQMCGEGTIILSESGLCQVLVEVLLQVSELVASLAGADPNDSRGSAAKTADFLDVDIETGVSCCDLFGYIAGLEDLLVFDFAEELECKVYVFEFDPLGVSFADVGLGGDFLLEICQSSSGFPVDVNRYETPHWILTG